jgi:hypothetical protein
MNKYHEVTIDELLDAAGGRSYVGYFDSNTAYELIFAAEKIHVNNLLKEYEMIGQIDPTEVIDWCDNNCRRSS